MLIGNKINITMHGNEIESGSGGEIWYVTTIPMEAQNIFNERSFQRLLIE